MALSWIPKGILDKIRCKCFTFLWSGKKDKRVLSWIRWERIALPKALGVWGLKNIFSFAKALVTKVGWRLLTTNSIWNEVVWQKYIAPLNVTNWLRDMVRQGTRVSVILKVVLKLIDVISQCLAWKVNNGDNCVLGLIPDGE